VCLKDLQRFLRQDDRRGRPAFFKLAQLHVARTDLVPIVTAYAHDVDLVYNARAYTMMFAACHSVDHLYEV